MKKAGITLMIAGILISIFTGLNFVTTEKVFEIGSLEVTQKQHHGLTWSPIIGVMAIVVGVVVYFIGMKRK